MSITKKLERRLAEIDAALGGEPEDLDNLRKSIVDEPERIVKRFSFLPDCKELFEIVFVNSEIVGGRYGQHDGKWIEFEAAEAEIVANAYDITEYD